MRSMIRILGRPMEGAERYPPRSNAALADCFAMTPSAYNDMILDNQYLTDILEKGRYPARIPPEQIRNISPRELMEGVTGR